MANGKFKDEPPKSEALVQAQQEANTALQRAREAIIKAEGELKDTFKAHTTIKQAQDSLTLGRYNQAKLEAEDAFALAQNAPKLKGAFVEDVQREIGRLQKEKFRLEKYKAQAKEPGWWTRRKIQASKALLKLSKKFDYTSMTGGVIEARQITSSLELEDWIRRVEHRINSLKELAHKWSEGGMQGMTPEQQELTRQIMLNNRGMREFVENILEQLKHKNPVDAKTTAGQLLDKGEIFYENYLYIRQQLMEHHQSLYEQGIATMKKWYGKWLLDDLFVRALKEGSFDFLAKENYLSTDASKRADIYKRLEPQLDRLMEYLRPKLKYHLSAKGGSRYSFTGGGRAYARARSLLGEALAAKGGHIEKIFSGSGFDSALSGMNLQTSEEAKVKTILQDNLQVSNKQAVRLLKHIYEWRNGAMRGYNTTRHWEKPKLSVDLKTVSRVTDTLSMYRYLMDLLAERTEVKSGVIRNIGKVLGGKAMLKRFARLLVNESIITQAWKKIEQGKYVSPDELRLLREFNQFSAYMMNHGAARWREVCATWMRMELKFKFVKFYRAWKWKIPDNSMAAFEKFTAPDSKMTPEEFAEEFVGHIRAKYGKVARYLEPLKEQVFQVAQKYADTRGTVEIKLGKGNKGREGIKPPVLPGEERVPLPENWEPPKHGLKSRAMYGATRRTFLTLMLQRLGRERIYKGPFYKAKVSLPRRVLLRAYTNFSRHPVFSTAVSVGAITGGIFTGRAVIGTLFGPTKEDAKLTIYRVEERIKKFDKFLKGIGFGKSVFERDAKNFYVLAIQRLKLRMGVKGRQGKKEIIGAKFYLVSSKYNYEKAIGMANKVSKDLDKLYVLARVRKKISDFESALERVRFGVRFKYPSLKKELKTRYKSEISILKLRLAPKIYTLPSEDGKKKEEIIGAGFYFKDNYEKSLDLANKVAKDLVELYNRAELYVISHGGSLPQVLTIPKKKIRAKGKAIPRKAVPGFKGKAVSRQERAKRKAKRKQKFLEEKKAKEAAKRAINTPIKWAKKYLSSMKYKSQWDTLMGRLILPTKRTNENIVALFEYIRTNMSEIQAGTLIEWPPEKLAGAVRITDAGAVISAVKTYNLAETLRSEETPAPAEVPKPSPAPRAPIRKQKRRKRKKPGSGSGFEE